MAKVKFENEEQLQTARIKNQNNINYRKTKDGRIIAASVKWPKKKKQESK